MRHATMNKRPRHILPLIVLAQFAGTSLWFTGNAVLPELKETLLLSTYALSFVTSAVMGGFIAGTLFFAILSIADRFSPSKVFLISCLAGSFFNLGVVWFANDSVSLFVFRFLTGFCIAGIYPVGMKIAADWYEKGLGKALGFLLGSLVLGTAFPHYLRDRDLELPWKEVLYFTSLFAIIGGLIVNFFVGNGPFRKKSGGFRWNAIGIIFKSTSWRKAAFGYFGHMWELYTFWGFLPVIIALYAGESFRAINIPFVCFMIIATGSISCVAGGYISLGVGSAAVARTALAISFVCCLLSPFLFDLPWVFFIAYLVIWGIAVIPDSPQFSTLVANHAPPELKGTALTIYNSIGFTISTISLIVMDYVFHSDGLLGGKNAFVILAIGPVAGLIGSRKMRG